MVRKYWKWTIWPRRRDHTLMFQNTVAAFFYATQIYDNDTEILNVKKEFEVIHKAYLKERDSKKPNLAFLFEIVFKRQFHRECLEEIQRLKDGNGGHHV